MLKLMTIVGTRPEIIRLSQTIKACDRYFEQVLVHTGQNFDYELNEIFFNDLDVRRPDYFLEAAAPTAAATIGNVIAAADELMGRVRPDAVLVLGDTNSCLSIIPAKRRKIPTFHMEAGNRCFDERVPEEINRRIIDHIADINLPYSQIARQYLLAEGLAPDRIICTGSPMMEVLSAYRSKIDASSALEAHGLTPGKYFLVSAHREENVDSERQLKRLCACLDAVASTYDEPILVSTHPRTRLRIDSFGVDFHPNVRLLKPLGFSDYVALQVGSRAVLSDSGTITEESSILNFPAVNLREAHERPEGMEQASVMMTGLDPARLIDALRILQDQNRGDTRDLRLVADYAAPNFSMKAVRIIMSYTSYVRRTVWKEYFDDLADDQ
jgi:UDP-N-acetylglucosamine 2-epimerase